MACSTVKGELQLSQWSGKWRGVRPNWMRRLSRNSSAERTVPFRKWGIAVSQAPVVLDRFICLEAAVVAASRMGVRAFERALVCVERHWRKTPAA